MIFRFRYDLFSFISVLKGFMHIHCIRIGKRDSAIHMSFGHRIMGRHPGSEVWM